MTLIRMHDIRENDVAESAGMSNIPWFVEYGFTRHEDATDTQFNILEELFDYEATDEDERVLDGLSPDANGQFFTKVRIVRNGQEMTVRYTREHLIRLANQILEKAAIDMALAIQREYLHEGPHLTMTYELCPSNGTMKCIVIDDMPHPLGQILDLRGFSVLGKMEWSEDAD